jgi:VIT1/CCC1 family predicted Fe2+/Mn2+ transporter
MTELSEEAKASRRAQRGVGRFQELLRELVYGGNDGIVTTFAVVAGFAGAGAEGAAEVGAVAVLLFGLANLFADATSMGLGAFLSSRSQSDVYETTRARELEEIRRNPETERAETVALLEDRGVSRADSESLADLFLRNPELMADFVMRYELGMSDPTDGPSPALEGLATFVSFVMFGAIPLLPYFLMEATAATFHTSVAATFAALVLLGLLRWRVTAMPIWRCLWETVAVGGVCAVIGYAVGLAFRG